MNINLLEIHESAAYINASITAGTGNRVAGVYAWNSETYKDAADMINLSSLLDGTTQNEVFTISAADLGTDYISGVWVIDFYANNSTVVPPSGAPKTNLPADEAPVTGVVANLVGYHECVLEKGMNIVVKDCTILPDNCGNTDSLIFASTLIDLLNQALTFSLIEEAVRIAQALDDVCDICAGCPDYAAGLSNIGYGFKTVNNVITPT